MRRSLAFIVVALLLASVSFVFADEAVLIDFSLLNANILPAGENGPNTQNQNTVMDFGDSVGSYYDDEQKKQMKTSLAIENWDVVLASSSRSITRQSLSYTREAKIADGNNYKFAGSTVLGVRINFPVEPFNSWARVSVPFDIPAFEETVVDGDGNVTDKENQQSDDPQNSKLTRFEGSYVENNKLVANGIVKNVGVLKSVAVNVKGLNFPHGLYLIFKDNDGNEQQIFMGYLKFDGWRELRWDNPQYISEVRNRELRVDPLYPKSSPFVKFAGFMIQRDADAVGGDCIVYVKDVKIIYDKAVLNPVTDIDDEAVWGIIGTKEAKRKKMEGEQFGERQVLRYIETQKRATESFDAQPETESATTEETATE